MTRPLYNDRCLGRAMLGSTDTCSASVRAAYGRIHRFFYVKVHTRFLRSIHVLLSALIVDNGSGMFCTGFAGLSAPRAVSDDCRQSEEEKGAQSMLQLMNIF